MTIHFLQNSFIRDKESQSVISYNREIAPSLEDICSPLFKNFNITMFTYSRIFSNGRRVYVSTNSHWVEHYISNSYQNEINHLEHYIPADCIRHALWGSYKMDKVFSSVYNNFNFWHGFSIYEKKEDYVDFFDFSAHKDNYKIVNFYLNNHLLLDHFVKYFQSKSIDLINFEDKDIWITPKAWVPFNEIPRTAIMNPDKLSAFDKAVGNNEKKIYYLNFPRKKNVNPIKRNQIISLCDVKCSERESQCINNLAQGKNAKEIGRDLNISANTVETYIKMVKKKTAVISSSNFIKYYENNLLFVKESPSAPENSKINKIKTYLNLIGKKYNTLRKRLDGTRSGSNNTVRGILQKISIISFQLYDAFMHMFNFMLVISFS